jgi:hypothetical protein
MNKKLRTKLKTKELPEKTCSISTSIVAQLITELNKKDNEIDRVEILPSGASITYYKPILPKRDRFLHSLCEVGLNIMV